MHVGMDRKKSSQTTINPLNGVVSPILDKAIVHTTRGGKNNLLPSTTYTS